MTQPDLVCVAVPGETSTVITADGTAHAVHFDDDRQFGFKLSRPE